ncbi:MAG: hypothetical protein ACPLYF_01550 [Fervidobacterium sp.]
MRKNESYGSGDMKPAYWFLQYAEKLSLITKKSTVKVRIAKLLTFKLILR